MFATSQTAVSTISSTITSTLTSSSSSSICSSINPQFSTNTKIRVLSGSNKRLLSEGIYRLSTNVQRDKPGEYVLKLENEALEHIENLVLEVFDSIILASSNLNNNSPEQTCVLIIRVLKKFS